jgi:hypothetical protein
MITQPVSVAVYESQVKRFKPERGHAATNSNEWFTHFEHAATDDFYLRYLDEENMHVAFPRQSPLTSHIDFARWYSNLLTQTLWNFHDVSAVDIKRTATHEFLVSFVVDWYGEVKADSDQAAGWQSRTDSLLHHHRLRQTWTVKVRDRLLIEKPIVAGGDTLSSANDVGREPDPSPGFALAACDGPSTARPPLLKDRTMLQERTQLNRHAIHGAFDAGNRALRTSPTPSRQRWYGASKVSRSLRRITQRRKRSSTRSSRRSPPASPVRASPFDRFASARSTRTATRSWSSGTDAASLATESRTKTATPGSW